MLFCSRAGALSFCRAAGDYLLGDVLMVFREPLVPEGRVGDDLRREAAFPEIAVQALRVCPHVARSRDRIDSVLAENQ